METKIFKNYNEFGSRTNKSTNGVTEDFLKDINKTLEDVHAFSLRECKKHIDNLLTK